MTLALEIVLVITSILLVVFILLHKGKGGGLSTLFGGGVQANLSGSTTVEKNLDRVTVILAIIWIVCIFGLNLTHTFAVPA
ncbi:preprotein translocase subunit SecG [Corynebacterium aquatimens]|uniref:preprotein translocase subunit SecG n=1 Tax=Corynebacterium TaxID=1716 RepID=UPI001F2F61ED|nr:MULTISPECIES: preprotein translocase subunit SecG [Corynebacterium]QYH19702.1 preprotein translocase subunit SecG [Corynebacterium aquatimens]UIZ93207.1 preprotein translocase subunit SecG [Corynebacterium sp. CNCTC7651]